MLFGVGVAKHDIAHSQTVPIGRGNLNLTLFLIVALRIPVKDLSVDFRFAKTTELVFMALIRFMQNTEVTGNHT
jgi:hypothetical protein